MARFECWQELQKVWRRFMATEKYQFGYLQKKKYSQCAICGAISKWLKDEEKKMLPTLQSLFDPIVGSVEKALEGFEEENQVIFNRELIRGIYLFGSQVYFCRKHGVLDENYSKLKFQTKDDEILEYLDDSDFDLIIVCDEMVSRNFSEGGLAADLQFKLYFDLPIKTFDGKELEVEFEVSLVNTKYFISFVNYHQPVLLQLICEEKLDERFVIYEEDSMRRWRREFGNYFLRIPRLKYAFIHELNYSMNKSFRFWNSYIESSQTDETSLKKVKKNICHGYRLLRVCFIEDSHI